MSKTLRKKTTFNELPLYRSINMFMLFITPVLFNCPKDIKQTYGDKIIKLGIETLVILKKSYNERDFDKKNLYVNDIYNYISSIELLFKILFELGHINEKTQANVSIQIGDILTQTQGWMKSIKRNLGENENEIDTLI